MNDAMLDYPRDEQVAAQERFDLHVRSARLVLESMVNGLGLPEDRLRKMDILRRAPSADQQPLTGKRLIGAAWL